jgi:retron-type reverse transcriptase
VLRRLDRRIAGFCAKRNWNYTRYCDDISISGRGGISPKELATVKIIIESEGFCINPIKTRIKRRCGRQEVTGLVVNEQTDIPRHRRKAIRAMFHQAFLYPEKFRPRLSELEGHLGFYRWMRPLDQKALASYTYAINRVRNSLGLEPTP